MTRIAVVGGGLTGLSAAWELGRVGVEAVVLESEQRAGGVVVTERSNGFVVEGGPDGFLAAEPDIQELAREVGIGDRLVDQQARGSSLWKGGRLEPLEEGRAAELLGIAGPAREDLAKGFRSFLGGMADIVDALVGRLGPVLRTASGVTRITSSGRGVMLALTGGSSVEAEGMILALPAGAAASLLEGLGLPPARELDDVRYDPSLTVSLAYRQDQVRANLQGTGFVAASRPGEGAVRACTYASLKYPGRAPAGHVLLRAFLASVDGDPSAVAHAELAKILAISGAPLWARVFHWIRGLPRYGPRHAERVGELRARLAGLAPVTIAGAGVDGAGVSACVRSGRTAAREILKRVSA